jgi:hypothetical protein
MATLTANAIEYSIKNLAGLNPYSPFQYIALGSGTDEEATDATDLSTEHTSNGLERAAATIEYIDPFKIRFSHTFLATGSATITEVGIFNDVYTLGVGGGEMYIRDVLAVPISVYSGDEIEVIYTHSII